MEEPIAPPGEPRTDDIRISDSIGSVRQWRSQEATADEAAPFCIEGRGDTGLEIDFSGILSEVVDGLNQPPVEPTEAHAPPHGSVDAELMQAQLPWQETLNAETSAPLDQLQQEQQQQWEAESPGASTPESPPATTTADTASPAIVAVAAAASRKVPRDRKPRKLPPYPIPEPKPLPNPALRKGGSLAWPPPSEDNKNTADPLHSLYSVLQVCLIP